MKNKEMKIDCCKKCIVTTLYPYKDSGKKVCGKENCLCHKPKTENWDWLIEKFDKLFPKDKEATDGLRPSKSHRSEALVLLGYFKVSLEKEKQLSFQEGYKKGFDDCFDRHLERSTDISNKAYKEILEFCKKENIEGESIFDIGSEFANPRDYKREAYNNALNKIEEFIKSKLQEK